MGRLNRSLLVIAGVWILVGVLTIVGFGVLHAQPASGPVYAQYTITATATALSASTVTWSRPIDSAHSFRKLTVKNAAGAANACYLGSSSVANTPANAGVELSAGTAYTFDYTAPSEVFIVGTANAANIAFIVAED